MKQLNDQQLSSEKYTINGLVIGKHTITGAEKLLNNPIGIIESVTDKKVTIITLDDYKCTAYDVLWAIKSNN